MPRIYKQGESFNEAMARIFSLNSAPKTRTVLVDFDGTETVKTVDLGWKPYAVYLDGSRLIEGDNEDYVISFAEFNWLVTFAIAPSDTLRAQIDIREARNV